MYSSVKKSLASPALVASISQALEALANFSLLPAVKTHPPQIALQQ